jgi:hypothetical protein
MWGTVGVHLWELPFYIATGHWLKSFSTMPIPFTNLLTDIEREHQKAIKKEIKAIKKLLKVKTKYVPHLKEEKKQIEELRANGLQLDPAA